MPAYRFYSIERTGHITTPPSYHELPDDLSATQEAKKLVNGKDIEIWQGSRLVAFLVSDEGQP